MMGAADEQIGYVEAVARLEAILGELESDDVDVDRLGERVRSAVELIRICRERISDAELEVTRIVADLDDGEQADPAQADGREE